MNSNEIFYKLKKKYNWKFDNELKKIIVINFDSKIKIYIGKILFFDTKNVGIRLLNSTDNILYNYKCNMISSSNMEKVLILNPNKNSINNIFENCNILIKGIIDEINNLNSSIDICCI